MTEARQRLCEGRSLFPCSTSVWRYHWRSSQAPTPLQAAPTPGETPHWVKSFIQEVFGMGLSCISCRASAAVTLIWGEISHTEFHPAPTSLPCNNSMSLPAIHRGDMVLSIAFTVQFGHLVLLQMACGRCFEAPRQVCPAWILLHDVKHLSGVVLLLVSTIY